MAEIEWRPLKSNGSEKRGFCTLLLECLATIGADSEHICYERSTGAEHDMGPTLLTLTVPRDLRIANSREIVEVFGRSVLEVYQTCARRALRRLSNHFEKELRDTEFNCLPKAIFAPRQWMVQEPCYRRFSRRESSFKERIAGQYILSQDQSLF
jgi:hypothetical protein